MLDGRSKGKRLFSSSQAETWMDDRDTHPEKMDSEIYIGNFTLSQITSITWETKRVGKVARTGEQVIPGYRPVFVQKSEIEDFVKENAKKPRAKKEKIKKKVPRKNTRKCNVRFVDPSTIERSMID